MAFAKPRFVNAQIKQVSKPHSHNVRVAAGRFVIGEETEEERLKREEMERLEAAKTRE